MNILKSAIDKISKLLERPKTYMDFLDEDEFGELIKLMDNWYLQGISFDKLLKNKNKSFITLIQKLKKKALEKPPQKLYRGLVFNTKKEQTDFIRNLNKGIYNSKKNENYSSWTTSKKVAKAFAGKGWHPKSKYGIILEINTNDFKENITFSTAPLFKTQKDTAIFLRLMLDEHNVKMKKEIQNPKINLDNMRDHHAFFSGSMYSIEEKEYILKNPTRNVDKIKYTIVDSK